MKTTFDYHIDLFSGAGGFSLGLQQAGIKFKQVFYSDIDKYANAVYKQNFPNHKELGDVKSITTESLPKGRGIICFGFPCQDLSIAGKRAGLDGHRSGLFYEAIRIIRDLQPEVFIFENVKGLFSADKGQAFIRVLREIADIGLYDCEWQLVNTRWVLPQNRERIYFIGHLRGSSTPKVFPIREIISRDKEERIKSKERIQISNCLTSTYSKMNGQGTLIKSNTKIKILDDSNSKIREDGDTPTLTSNCGAKARRNGIKVIKQSSIRRLTPIECERLQGFPDNWTAKGNFNGEIKEISDTQRYKLMGNAVTVKIVKMIGEKLNDK